MWGIGDKSEAQRRFRNRSLWLMTAYLIVTWGSTWMVRHEHPQGWPLYFWALLPAIPVISVLAQMGRYLQEEKDEYLRMLTTRSMLVGTGALLGTLVVNDLLRGLTTTGSIPPFAGLVIFMLSFSVAQGVQMLRDPGGDDELSA